MTPLPHPWAYSVLPDTRGAASSGPSLSQVFDNEEFDCRTPNEWINMGLEPGSQNRKPVPGKALLPTDDFLGHGKQGAMGGQEPFEASQLDTGQGTGLTEVGNAGIKDGIWSITGHCESHKSL